MVLDHVVVGRAHDFEEFVAVLVEEFEDGEGAAVGGLNFS